jgi:UDP-N-acetylmuramate--alanine ligase
MSTTVMSNPTLNPYTGPIHLTRPHFVGIGGSAMSALAQLCQARGAKVSGTDAVDSERIAVLRDLGCAVTIGHDPAAVHGASCVVYTAVTQASPEVAAALDAGIPVVHRAQVLQALSTDRRLVAVAGTHGKSTTTGILAAALRALGEDPSYLVGADLDQPGSGARHGKGDLIIAEADESDHSFQLLAPYAAVVTTIAHDHPENYANLREHIDAYTTFVNGLRGGGIFVANADDDSVRVLIERVRTQRPDVHVVTYGHDERATVRVQSVERRGWSAKVRVTLPGETPVVIRLHTPSRQHAHNAVAALAVLAALGTDPVAAAEAVSTFVGVRRRFMPVGENAGVTVIDCYADHPNEIAADLEAARAVAGTHRVLAVVQPSGYARVAAFGRDMGTALAAGADHTVLLDVHGAGPQGAVSSTIVGDAIAAAGGHLLFAGLGAAAHEVATLARPGDVILMMGTGNVTDLAGPILAALAQDRLTVSR